MKRDIRWLPDLEKLLPLPLGICLGALFCYSGIKKHQAVVDFAEAILAYQLLPELLVGLVAAVLPWLEITVGALLVLGFFLRAEKWWSYDPGPLGGLVIISGLTRQSCLLLMVLQLSFFLLVLLVTMARGLRIDCGCGLFTTRQVGLIALLEDGALLLAAVWLYLQEVRKD